MFKPDVLSALPAPRRRQRVTLSIFSALVIVILMLAFSNSAASAKAPPLATTVLEVEAYESPGYEATVVAVLPAGTAVELTGAAAPGFLAVYYDGQEVFVPAQYLSLGSRPGIDTAETVADTPLLDAPMRDADVQVTVPAGQTVLLTGASVDGYDAASYDGKGGWIDQRGLAQ